MLPSSRNAAGTPSQGDTMESEKRRTPRYVFFAAAELVEEKSEVRIASRLSELSLRGCYLDMMKPFPVGTSILLKIWTDENSVFQSKAKGIYSQANVGAGRACRVRVSNCSVVVWLLGDRSGLFAFAFLVLSTRGVGGGRTGRPRY